MIRIASLLEYREEGVDLLWWYYSSEHVVDDILELPGGLEDLLHGAFHPEVLDEILVAGEDCLDVIV